MTHAWPLEAGRQGQLEPPHFLCHPFQHHNIMAYARTRYARLVCKPHAKQLVLIQQVRRSIGMSTSHSLVIGDKPIELLTIAERCDFGRGLIIFGRGFKILCARLIVTKLYIARASPVLKPFLQPCHACIAWLTIHNMYVCQEYWIVHNINISITIIILYLEMRNHIPKRNNFGLLDCNGITLSGGLNMSFVCTKGTIIYNYYIIWLHNYIPSINLLFCGYYDVTYVVIALKFRAFTEHFWDRKIHRIIH